MNQDDVTKAEAVGGQPPGRPLDPAKAPVPPADEAGPTSPGLPEPAVETGPQSGGYDERPPAAVSGNAKGGYGAG